MVRPIVLSPTRQAVLEALATQRHPVEPDDVRLGDLVGGRLTGTLHDMRKIGLVEFTESTNAAGRGGHHRGIKRISITDKGRMVLGTAPRSEPNNAANDTLSRAEELAANMMESYKTHATRGSAIIGFGRRVRELPPEEAAVALPDVLDEPEITDEDVEIANSHLSVYPEPASELIIDEDTGPEFPTPVLDDLRRKQEKVQAAAALLEEAGLDDEAIRVLDALRLSEVEQEYLAFAKVCGR
jgi:hypothetical protein